MTREKAVEVSRALDYLESFELMADRLMQIVDEDDNYHFSGFRYELEQLLNHESERLKSILEEL